MRLEKASFKAIKYACLNFHYAKGVPTYSLGYSVFNNNNEWCGVILFGGGASVNMPTKFNLKNGQYLELNRMALNGKQSSTSKVLSIAIKLVKKECKTVKMLFSYADKGQNHNGIIYQATNWIYIENIESSGTEYFINNVWKHDRGRYNWKVDFKTLPKRKKAGKHKYVFPLDKKLIDICNKIKKPYPKINAIVAHLGEQQTTSLEGAFDATVSLNIKTKAI
jgi:hypothetical protein